MANKVKYGLKNVYYSVITLANNVPSYATPVNIPGAVNLALSPVGEKVKFPADDIEDYFAENINNGYDGSLEMALIPDSFRSDVLGDTVDTNGAVIENANSTVKRFALMFEFDGDAKKTRHVLYNVLANRPGIEGKTRTSTKEPNSDKLDIEARPALDTSDVKAKVEQGGTGYDTFFSAVYLKNAVTNTAADPADFSKAGSVDVAIDVTSSSGTNAVKSVYVDGVPVGFAHLTISGVDVTLANAFIDTLDNGDHTILIEFTQGNAVSVTLTVGA
ncbi:MAG: major tail protein [Syntrophomonas sp.]